MAQIVNGEMNYTHINQMKFLKYKFSKWCSKIGNQNIKQGEQHRKIFLVYDHNSVKKDITPMSKYKKGAQVKQEELMS